MNLINKTKLVITLGPSTDLLWTFNKESLLIENHKTLEKNFIAMANSGVNVMRFNLSHETFDIHNKRLEIIRELNKKVITPIAVLFDTKGPEIRVNNIQTKSLEDNLIKLNDQVVVTCLNPDYVGDGKQFNISDSTKTYNMANDVKIGQEIYVDDGKLVLKVKEINKQQGIINCVSLSNDYVIRTNKRINLVNSNYSMPFLSPYDIQCIEWASELNVEFLALSFLSKPEDLDDVKEIMLRKNPKCTTKLISKIESSEAINNLEEIVKKSDGIMIARGDLALEIGYQNVPFYEEQILQLTNQYKKFAIVATQMLDSMETNNLPTRAETTDCYYATKLLADATMLSGETASGKHPIKVIETMKLITNTAEKFNKQPVVKTYPNFTIGSFYERTIEKIGTLIANKEYAILKNFNDTELQIISKLNWSTKFIILDKFNNLSLNQNLYRNITLVSEEMVKKLDDYLENLVIIDKKTF